MPGYDGSGPQGQGPMTGRGMGYCRTGETRSSGANYGQGRGGLPRGGGRGFGARYRNRMFSRNAGAQSYEPLPEEENVSAGGLNRLVGALEKLVDKLDKK